MNCPDCDIEMIDYYDHYRCPRCNGTITDGKFVGCIYHEPVE